MAIETIETWADLAGHRLFVKMWRPRLPRRARPEQVAPLVLFHESLGSVALWRDFPVQLAMACGRPVVAYDRLGFGCSDPHPGLLTPSFVAAEAGEGFAAVRQRLGFDRFIAFGHSVGGGMATVCAVTHGASCLAVITEAAQAFVEDVTLAGIRRAQSAFARPDRMQRLTTYHGDKAAWVLSAWIDRWLSAEFQGWSLQGILPAVRCPMLVLQGACDEFGSPRHVARFMGAVRGPISAHILPQCGHVPHRDDPQRIIRLVRLFLQNVLG